MWDEVVTEMGRMMLVDWINDNQCGADIVDWGSYRGLIVVVRLGILHQEGFPRVRISRLRLV